MLNLQAGYQDSGSHFPASVPGPLSPVASTEPVAAAYSNLVRIHLRKRSFPCSRLGVKSQLRTLCPGDVAGPLHNHLEMNVG